MGVSLKNNDVVGTIDKSIERPVRSPCVGVCALDNNDLCIACRRSGIEIGEWGVLSNDQRKDVIKKIEQRYLDDMR
ncbi:DUF1289 domain-containing protein [Neptunomonas antarctica]|uniref:Fe-S protein n=1 Tax=Neptunomonas antarctica TaxID=619304 RepID=A0A1N7J6L0_9GAMM|nr:DUF1289 domain-containing protein [Neptunomonas antarctica]SIS44942.1 Protein of unknown function [Neptunomonas antarctica]